MNISHLCTTRSPYNYLETIATQKVMEEVGERPLGRLENFVHRIFYDLLYPLLPWYAAFYESKQIEVFTQYQKPLPPYVHSTLREGILFLHQFIASPTTIGSILPSSEGLVKAMTKKIGEGVSPIEPPRRYLDIGAGTGVFSAAIIAQKRPQDVVDLVEFDLTLANLLQKRFQHVENVHVRHVSIFEFQPQDSYDVVVTGLPLNNFSSEDVAKAFQKYASLTKPGGSFCYFEYMLFPKIGQVLRKVFSLHIAYQNTEEIEKIKSAVQKRFSTETDSIYWNITPAKAIHCTVA